MWLQLCKGWFPLQRRGKLSPRGDGHFQVLEKINNNAYWLNLHNVSATFNVADLNPFLVDDEQDLRTNPSQEQRNDSGAQAFYEIWASSIDPIKVPIGPITWAWAKNLEDSLQALVRVVQEQEGTYKHIEKVELEHQCEPTMTLIHIEDVDEGSVL